MPRLDHIMAARLPEWSRTRVQALIRAGGVKVNGTAAVKPSFLVEAPDLIEWNATESEPRPASAEAEAIPLEVIYEDDDLGVIYKPAGLLVHPGSGQQTGTLVNALLHRYGTLSSVGGASRGGIVHRLDRSTSGLMVVARTDFAHAHLARQFQARTVAKTYLTLVHGLLTPAEGEVALAIGRDLHLRKRMTTRRTDARSRTALTRYKVLALYPAPKTTPAADRAASSFSWVEVHIHTGRTHQIRVHMAALGHPVVGDRLYGAAGALTGPGALKGVRPERVMLHAYELGFTHPRSGERLSFRADPPAEMGDFVTRVEAASL